MNVTWQLFPPWVGDVDGRLQDTPGTAGSLSLLHIRSHTSPEIRRFGSRVLIWNTRGSTPGALRVWASPRAALGVVGELMMHGQAPDSLAGDVLRRFAVLIVAAFDTVGSGQSRPGACYPTKVALSLISRVISEV